VHAAEEAVMRAIPFVLITICSIPAYHARGCRLCRQLVRKLRHRP